ncbi:MAG: hypothetical protein ACJ75J_06220 [Cytophagaceae bacterium]
MKSYYVKISSFICALFISIQAFGVVGSSVVSNLTDSNPGSLRAAILYANSNPGSIITFTATGTGIITLASPLPSIDLTTTIDGTTGFGYNASTGIPVISIQASGFSAGLVVNGSAASNSIIKAIHIADDMSNSIGIDINGADNVVVIGCYLYTDYSSPNSDGFRPLDNAALGIRIQNSFVGVIGGASSDSSNIFSCQMPLFFISTSSGIVRGNFLNTDKTGNMPSGTYPGSFNTGMSLYGANSLIIEQNVIGNCYTAMNISNNGGLNSNNNVIRKNYIGVNTTETSKLYIGTGIWQANGLNSYNTFDSNVIAWCTGSPGSGSAIYLNAGNDFNLITRNKIYGNTGGGIILNSGNQNYPSPTFSTSAYTISAGKATITGTSLAGDTIEIFIADTSGLGPQGALFKIDTIADATGAWSVNTPFAAGAAITATARNGRNTSGFSTLANVFDCANIMANAGTDVTLCTNANLNLNGTFKNASDGAWTSTGTGSFSNPGTANTVYYPTPADTAAHSLTFTFTTAGPCIATQSDQMVVTFVGARTANAGPDQTLCSSATQVQLAGSLSYTSKGKWSGGNGSFVNGNDSIPNAIYIIDYANDFIDGPGFTLTYTPIGTSGSCGNTDDGMDIHIEYPASISASVPNGTTICSGTVWLIANYPKGSFGTPSVTAAAWSSSLNKGTFAPSVSVPNGSPYNYYTPAPEDYAAGSVYLYLTATSLSGGTGACPMPVDSVLLTLNQAPIVFAGNDTTVCTLNPIVLQHASVTGASSYLWTHNGAGGFLPNTDTLLSTTYYPSVNGESSSIYLVLSNTNGCGSASDSILVNFVTAPLSNAGRDTLICQGQNIQLNGMVSASVPFTWSTNGSGKFRCCCTKLVCQWFMTMRRHFFRMVIR